MTILKEALPNNTPHPDARRVAVRIDAHAGARAGERGR